MTDLLKDEQLTRLNNILKGCVTREYLSVIKQITQLENMYPYQPIEFWDIHHAEEYFRLEQELAWIKSFENT